MYIRVAHGCVSGCVGVCGYSLFSQCLCVMYVSISAVVSSNAYYDYGREKGFSCVVTVIFFSMNDLVLFNILHASDSFRYSIGFHLSGFSEIYFGLEKLKCYYAGDKCRE